jgi:hypothetical protein
MPIGLVVQKNEMDGASELAGFETPEPLAEEAPLDYLVQED